MKRLSALKTVVVMVCCLSFTAAGLLGTPPATWAGDTAQAELAALVNINTATAEKLTTLKGIGEKTAAAIVAYREANGAFGAIEDIMQVKGVGEAKFAGIKDQITVKAAKAVE